jgi:hypothetical protein
VDNNLMMAVLSMDAYFNRAEGWQVGNAMINKPPADPVSGFEAYAYSRNGAEVIAFRGTDNLSDVLHGWLAGGGFAAFVQESRNLRKLGVIDEPRFADRLKVSIGEHRSS